MRAIDADALVAKMNLAIAMLKRTMKNFDIEDDPECQMELKAYQDIRNGIKDEPTIEPEPCEDAVPRTSVEYICRKNTVSTNPCEHKYHDKFIQFMDDPEISDFGRWQLSNGFNTALVAVKCDLDKVPSVTLKQPGWIPLDKNTRNSMKYTLQTLYRLAYNIHGVMDVIDDNNVKRMIALLEGGQDE